MANTQLRISSNMNPYETARLRLENNPLYDEDLWLRESKSGGLDAYIFAIDKIGASDQSVASFYENYNYDYATDTDKIAALYNEAFANRSNTDVVRVGILKDAYDNPIYDENGDVKTYEYTASDYDYYKSMIKENSDIKYQEWLVEQSNERKNSMNGFVKVLGDIASVGTSLTYGLVDQVSNIADVFGSLAVATENAINDDANWLDAYAASLSHDPLTDPILDGIINFESNYTHMRDVSGNYTTLGKYVGGVCNTLGMMIPSLVTAGLLGKAGVGEKVISGISSSVFYTGATSGNIADTYRQYNASISTQQIIANAAIKSVLEYGVERVLGKIAGGTLLDDLMFGRQSGGRMFGKTFTKQGLIRIGKDALQEGTEEVLQDWSSYYVDKSMSLINRNFGKLSELSLQSIWDAFAIGAIASVAGNAKRFLYNKKNLTTIGQFVRDKDGKIKVDSDGNPVLARLSKFSQQEYDITMRGFIENISEIISDTSPNRDYALTQAYASFRMIGSIYTQIGHDRFEAAVKTLDEMQKTVDHNDAYYKNQATKMLQTIVDIRRNLSKDAITKFKDDAVKANISGETVVVTDDTANTVDQKKRNIYERFKRFFPKTEAIVFANEGSDVIVSDNIVVAPKNMALIDIAKRVTEKKLVDRIVNGKYDVDVISVIRSQYKELFGEFDGTDEDLIASLLFEENHALLDFCVFNADSDMFKFYSSLESLESYVVSDDERNDPVYKLAWESFIHAYHKSLFDYCKSTLDADYRRINFTESEVKEIETFHSLLIGDIVRRRTLNNDELAIVDNVLTALRVSDEIKSSVLHDLTESFAGKRVDALNKINVISENRFSGPYDGTVYLPNTSVSNRAFNSYLKSNGLTIDTLFDESKLTPSDIACISDIGFNVHGFRKYQFTDYTNGNYNLDITGDGKCIVSASPKLWAALTQGQTSKNYQDRQMEMIGKHRDAAKSRNLYNVVNERDYTSGIVSSDLDPSIVSYVTITDLVFNPKLLNDEIRKFINPKYEGAPNHVAAAIDMYLQSKYNNVGLVITSDGNYKICEIDDFFSVSIDNDAFSKIIEKLNNTNEVSIDATELLSSNEDRFAVAFEGVRVVFNKSSNDVRGSYNSKDNVIRINVNPRDIGTILNRGIIKSLSDTIINGVKYTISHELAHRYQKRYKLAQGSSSHTFTKQDINNKVAREFLIDVLSHMYKVIDAKTPFRKMSNEDLLKYIDHANAYIYMLTAGELMANSLSNELSYAPFIFKYGDQHIRIITPWGKTYTLDYSMNTDYTMKRDWSAESYGNIVMSKDYDTTSNISITPSQESRISYDENIVDIYNQESMPLSDDSVKRNVVKVEADKVYFKLPKTKERVTVTADASFDPESGIYSISRDHRGFVYYTGQVTDSAHGRIDTRKYYYYRENDNRQYLSEGGGTLYNMLRKHAGQRADKRIVEFVNGLDQLASVNADLIPPEFVSALDKGIFNVHNLMNWFGNVDDMSDEIFNLINETFFNNEYIYDAKDLEELQYRFVTEYMMYRFFKKRWDELVEAVPSLKSKNKDDVLNMQVDAFNRFWAKLIDENYAVSRMLDGFFDWKINKEIQETIGTKAPKQYLRELLMFLYDGRVDSVAKIAESIHISVSKLEKHGVSGAGGTNMIDDSNRGYIGASTNGSENVDGDRYATMASVLMKVADAYINGEFNIISELSIGPWLQKNLNLILLTQRLSQKELEDELRNQPDVVDSFYENVNIAVGEKKSNAVEQKTTERTPRQIVQNFKNKFNRLKPKIAAIGTEAFLNKSVTIDGNEISYRDYFIVNDNGNLVINPRLYKKFITRKGIEVDSNHYLDAEVLKKIESDISVIAAQVREDYAAIVKRDVDFEKEKRKTERLEAALKRSREQTAATKEKLKAEKAKKRASASSDGKYKFDPNLKVPAIIEKIHETTYSKRRKTKVQFVSDDTDNHVQLKLSEFYEQNADALESMTQSDVDDIVYYYTHGGMYNQTDVTRIAFVSFLLRGKDGNRYPLTKEQEEALRQSLRDIISQTGRDMKQWGLILKGWKLEQARLQHYASVSDVKFRDDDISAFANALEESDIKKLVELKSRMYRNAVTDYRQRSELGKLLPDIEKLIESIENGDSINDVNVKMNAIIDRISGNVTSSGDIVTLTDGGEFAKIISEYTEKLLQLKSDQNDEEFEIEVFKFKTIFTPGKKADIWTKLLQFERTAMLSSPGTWIRNKTSNWSLRGFNILSDKVGKIAGDFLIDKTLKKNRDKRKSIVKASKIYETTTRWKDTDQHKWVIEHLTKKYQSDAGDEAGLLDLIASNLSKYDPRSSERRSDNWVDVITDMVTNGIKQEIFYTTIGESDFKSKYNIVNKSVNSLNKINTMFSEIVMKAMSDSDVVKNTAVQYITQRLINEGYAVPKKGSPAPEGKSLIVRKRVVDSNTGKVISEYSPNFNNKIIKIIAESYTLAASDYMHKGNFFSEIEKSLEKRLSRPAFFMYKQILPFAAASYNWFIEGVNFTPIGLVNAIKDFAKLESYVQKLDEKYARGESNIRGEQGVQDVYRRLGKGIIGTIGFGIGIMLAAFGWLSIDDEDDKLKLVVGNVKVDFSDLFGSQGILIGSVMTSSLIRDGADLDKVAIATLDQMFLDSTFTDMYDAFRYTDSFGEYLTTMPTNMLSMFTPNILKTVTAVVSPYKVNYTAGAWKYLQRWTASAIPGAALAMPKYIDPFTGEIRYRYNDSWIESAGITIVNKLLPIGIAAYPYSDAERESLSLGLKKSPLTGRYTVNDANVNLTPAEQEKLNLLYGNLNKRELDLLFSGKKTYRVLDDDGNYVELRYNKMNDAQKKAAINGTMSANSSLAKIYAMTELRGYKYYTSEEQFVKLKKLGYKNVYKNVSKNKKSDYYKK